MPVRVLRHYVPFSLIALGAIEALILLTAIYLGVALRFNIASTDATSAGEHLALLPKAIVFTLVMLHTTAALGLYQRGPDVVRLVRCFSNRGGESE